MAPHNSHTQFKDFLGGGGEFQPPLCMKPCPDKAGSVTYLLDVTPSNSVTPIITTHSTVCQLKDLVAKQQILLQAILSGY